MKKWGAILFIFAMSYGQISFGADLSPLEIYSKCYSRLTDFPIEIDSPEYKKVEDGRLDPIQACKNLFNRAIFDISGKTKTLKDEKDPIARSILRNLNQFHISWFTSLGTSPNIATQGIYNFSDATEPALFITDALFGGRNFKSIFTRNNSLRGIRKGESTKYYTIDQTEFTNRPLVTGPFAEPSDTRNGNWSLLDFERVPQGYLIGFEEPPNSKFQLRFFYYEDSIKPSNFSSPKDDTKTINLTENHGGGLLGSLAYITSNSESAQRPDGGNKVHRRLANNTFGDLMCLTLPTLLNSDIDQYMQTYKDSDLSFRQDRSCARCHATLDPFAHTFRNFSSITTAGNDYIDKIRADGFKRAFPIRVHRKYKVRTSEQSVADSDPHYIRRTPEGKLYYRDYDGNLINEPVNGLEELGQKIAQQNDIYVCAAQRYYKFLTGISVPVENQSGTPFYQKHREQVVKLGLNLKEHGSLKDLIFEIFETPAFLTRNPAIDFEQGGQ